MNENRFVIETKKPFAESLIWQLNRDYYDKEGIGAWSSGAVPHHLTSNSMVGKTYAELIYGFLKDLARKGQTKEPAYILELGAGHGRFCFHILKHLERLEEGSDLKLPPYCYVLSDVVEDNLTFFIEHHQFQSFYESGKLDVAYFDAVKSDKLVLRKANKTILADGLEQPLLVLANYFFDSIPTDLFHFDNTKISQCLVSIDSGQDPAGQPAANLIEKIDLTFHKSPITVVPYENEFLNEILENYRQSLFNTYLFFPRTGIQCIDNLKKLSKGGLLLLSMDKGFHDLHDLENVPVPDMIPHGSLSFWVNFHSLGAYCEKTGGTSIFPEFSNFHLNLACLFFLPDGDSFSETKNAYRRFVDEFGPDDFTGMKKFTYKHIAKMELRELIGMLRLGYYDSAMFINVLPRLKQVYSRITFNDRKRLAQTMRQTWNMHFHLNEKEDLAFEIGGMLYALGFHKEALTYFDHSLAQYGETTDEFYNRALCYYQLREDKLFLKTVKAAKISFPNFKQFDQLDALDLGAA